MGKELFVSPRMIMEIVLLLIRLLSYKSDRNSAQIANNATKIAGFPEKYELVFSSDVNLVFLSG